MIFHSHSANVLNHPLCLNVLPSTCIHTKASSCFTVKEWTWLTTLRAVALSSQLTTADLGLPPTHFTCGLQRCIPSDMVSSLGGGCATPDAIESGQNLWTGLFWAVFFFVFGVSEQLESNIGWRIRLLALMNLCVDKGTFVKPWCWVNTLNEHTTLGTMLKSGEHYNTTWGMTETGIIYIRKTACCLKSNSLK
jgi:hypothetical protein